MALYQTTYREQDAGGFTRRDGTVEFYSRVNALIKPDMTVVDLGAGRGRAIEDEVEFRRALSILKGKVKRVIGLDVADDVKCNPMVDEAFVFDGVSIPLADGSVDLVLSDWTFEHIANPGAIEAEIFRILKPGGWVCARTPHRLSLVAIGSRMVPNTLHATVIKRVQPGGRTAADVFPTYYRLNSIATIARVFPHSRWHDYSYTYSPEPAYNFGIVHIVRLLTALQYVKGLFSGENLFVFLRKHLDGYSAYSPPPRSQITAKLQKQL